MDGSLASIFMNSAPPNPWPCPNEESPEDLQYKLLCASMELESMKAASMAEERIQEAKLSKLQELLSLVRKERDEAREECRKLQERLLQQTASSAGSPCSLMHSSSMVSSPSSSPWSLEELEEHLNSDTFCEFSKTPTPMELQQALQSFSQRCNVEQDLQALFSLGPACESVPEVSEQHFNLEMLEQDLSFDADPCLNLTDSKPASQELEIVCKQTPTTRSLSRQSSSNSSSASVQMYQHQPTPVAPPPPCSAELAMAPSIGGSRAIAINSTCPSISKPMTPPPVISTASAEALPAVSNISTMPSLPVKQGTTVVRQVHLPEPPEADPKVMLSSLPEKGKLLQAVMQAGPLLQTLMLAGPLPQWRYPPPALSTGDIPKVCMMSAAGNVFLPYPTCMPASVIPAPLRGHNPIHKDGSPSSGRVRVANAEPCSRVKKLRKLSPAWPHQSQLMRTVSGDGRMANGVSYAPTIY